MRGRWWKIIGLAGLAGVAATGAVLARNERRRQAYTPDEIRSRLQERYAEAATAEPSKAPGQDGQAAEATTERSPSWRRRWFARR
jgi:hypothetical protein